jgi:hypothetical protein
LTHTSEHSADIYCAWEDTECGEPNWRNLQRQVEHHIAAK